MTTTDPTIVTSFAISTDEALDPGGNVMLALRIAHHAGPAFVYVLTPTEAMVLCNAIIDFGRSHSTPPDAA